MTPGLKYCRSRRHCLIRLPAYRIFHVDRFPGTGKENEDKAKSLRLYFLAPSDGLPPLLEAEKNLTTKT